MKLSGTGASVLPNCTRLANSASRADARYTRCAGLESNEQIPREHRFDRLDPLAAALATCLHQRQVSLERLPLEVFSRDMLLPGLCIDGVPIHYASSSPPRDTVAAGSRARFIIILYGTIAANGWPRVIRSSAVSVDADTPILKKYISGFSCELRPTAHYTP